MTAKQVEQILRTVAYKLGSQYTYLEENAIKEIVKAVIRQQSIESDRDWCDVCDAPQNVLEDGEHRCGENDTLQFLKSYSFGRRCPECHVSRDLRLHNRGCRLAAAIKLAEKKGR